MKVDKLVKKLYIAILNKDSALEKKLWLKVLKKSLKHKKTYVVK